MPFGYFTYRHMSDDTTFMFNINNIVPFGIVSTLYPVFTTNEELDSEFLHYELNYGVEFARYAVMQKQGGSRTYMYLSKLQKLSLTMPIEVAEQEKVSKLLCSVDSLIAHHQRSKKIMEQNCPTIHNFELILSWLDASLFYHCPDSLTLE